MSKSETIVFDLAKKHLIFIALFLTIGGFYTGLNALVVPEDTLTNLPIISFISRTFPEYRELHTGLVSSLSIVFLMSGAIGVTILVGLTKKHNRKIVIGDKLLLIPNFSRSVPYVILKDQISNIEDIGHYIILHIKNGSCNTKAIIFKKMLNGSNDIIEAIATNTETKSYTLQYSPIDNPNIVKSSALLQKLFKTTEEKAKKLAIVKGLIIKKEMSCAAAEGLKSKLAGHGLNTYIEEIKDNVKEASQNYKITQINGIPTFLLFTLFIMPGATILWVVYVEWFISRFRNTRFWKAYFVAAFVEVITYDSYLLALEPESVSGVASGILILLGMISLSFMVALQINDLDENEYSHELKLNYLFVLLFGPFYINYKLNRVGKSQFEQLSLSAPILMTNEKVVAQ